jgi:ATP phosphoribosyltransferase regulatory subunit
MPGLKEITASYQEGTRAACWRCPTCTAIFPSSPVRASPAGAARHRPGAGRTAALAELAAGHEGAAVTIDLADLRGYHYQSGVMFSAYVPGLPNAVVRGGRYDHVGEAFGRARPATGFSLDLRELARLLPAQNENAPSSPLGAGTPVCVRK